MTAIIEKSKMDWAVNIIGEMLMNHRRPVLYFSGGKDSMVLLHILRFQLNLEIDAIFHKEPFLTEKYIFGESVLRKWNVVAFDYPPLETGMWLGKGIVAYTNFYQVGNQEDGTPAVLALPKNIVETPEGSTEEKWVCGRERFIMRPKGGFDYPWDMAFIGHKSSDEDQIAGKVPLHCDYHQTPGGPMLAFPLRHWTDDDVWDYTEQYRLPIDTRRYDLQSRREFGDKSMNSDYFHSCISCLDRRKSGMVHCPKFGRPIESMAERVPYQEIQLAYFGEKATTLDHASASN